MKRLLVIFCFLATSAFCADDFNWSWEKEPGLPAISEKPVVAATGLAGQGAEAPAAGVSQPAAAVRTPVSVVPDPALADSANPLPASVPAPAPDFGGRKPAAPSDDNFFWTWENEATNRLKSRGTVSARPEVVRGNEESVLPPSSPAEKTVEVPASLDAGQAVPAPAAIPEPKPAAESRNVPIAETEARSVLPEKSVAENAVPAAASAVPAAGRIDARAYDELIRENLELQKKIAETRQGKDLVKQENERLAREVKDLEQKISDSVSRIKELAKQKDASAVVPEKMKELEARLEKAEQEKASLGVQMAALQKKISVQGREPAAPVAEAAVRRAAGSDPAADSVKPGSDLHVRLERENVLLKQKLAEIELERQKAVRAREEVERKERLAAQEALRAQESQKQMRDKLEEVKSVEKKQKRLMVDLADRIPEMEKELSSLQKKLSEKDTELKEKERHLEILANEVELRENRIRKAEKMVDLMEQAQKDVSQASDSEKRDMHYNMAAVYSQVGRYADAEREYLHALRIDPADADVHYNLGILYDENLHDKTRAAMHYRRYLKLRPSGPDVDAVKSWLINIDMKQ